MAKKYISVEEINASEIDFSYRWMADPEKRAFIEDVKLRLEQTGKNKAIKYTFKNRKIAESYRNYAMKKLRDILGPRKVSTRVVPAEDGTVWVCFKNN